MARVDKNMTGIKKRSLVEHGIPVQAYIPKEIFLRFKRKYPRRGAVSKLIRKAFLLATEDGPNAGTQFADPHGPGDTERR